MSHAGKLLRSHKDRNRHEPQSGICGKCGKQRGYKSEGDAIIGALSASRAKGKPFRVYQCTKGDPAALPEPNALWHITSKARPEQSAWFEKVRPVAK